MVCLKVELSRFIVVDSEVCHGKPVFKGTRVLVSDILELLSTGMTIEEILKEYPTVTKEMVLDALSFAAKLLRGEAYTKHEEISLRREYTQNRREVSGG